MQICSKVNKQCVTDETQDKALGQQGYTYFSKSISLARATKMVQKICYSAKSEKHRACHYYN